MPQIRPLVWMSVFTGISLCILIALGVWQLSRRAEKHAFIAAIAARHTAPPVSLDEALALPDPNYARIRIELPTECATQVLINQFRIVKSATVPGATLITATRTPNGKTLLVARGFVPKTELDTWGGKVEAAPCPNNVSGVGVITPSSKPLYFTPAPDRIRKLWYSFDAEDIAKANALDLVGPWILRMEPDPTASGWPQAEAYATDVPDNHLIYALTWFGLAFTLIGVYIAYHMAQGRLRFAS